MSSFLKSFIREKNPEIMNTVQSRFFVIYPKENESEAHTVLEQIKERLFIEYELWSYSAVDDEADYFEKVVTPAVENADFVLVFVAKGSTDDYLLSETCRLCSNLNKRIAPVKIGNGRVKSKDWNFRSEILDYSDESERITIIEQMHSWLGLPKVGDVYGSTVTLSADLPYTVKRGDVILGSGRSKEKIDCVLSKGTDYLHFLTGNEWNMYQYSIRDNNSHLEFEASLSGLKQLSSSSTDLMLYDPSSSADCDWDMTHRNDFALVASSMDDKKRNVITQSYQKYYDSMRVSYPEFVPEKLPEPIKIHWILWLIAIVLTIWAYGLGIIMLIICYAVKKGREKQIERTRERNARRCQELNSSTENKAKMIWQDVNSRMNAALSNRNLEGASLSYCEPMGSRCYYNGR